MANNDMRRMALAGSFQNALVWFVFNEGFQRAGRWCLTWVSELFLLRFSRKREYWADAVGAVLTSREAMMSALRKIHESPPALSAYERAGCQDDVPRSHCRRDPFNPRNA